MQKKKGISLIVLVITIIVMVILAGAIILTLNNSGIIQKASDAVDKTNEATIKEVAQLGWAEAYTEYGANQAKLEEGVNNALIKNNIAPEDYAIKITTSGVTIKAKKDMWVKEGFTVVKGDQVLEIGDTISYTATGTTYNSGWKLLGADEDGNLLIMSARDVKTGHRLGYENAMTTEEAKLVEIENDWRNGITELNNICEQYGKGIGVVGKARSISVDDVNLVAGYNPETAGYAKGGIQEYGNEVTYDWDASDTNNIKLLYKGTLNDEAGSIDYSLSWNKFVWCDETTGTISSIIMGEEIPPMLKVKCTYYNYVTSNASSDIIVINKNENSKAYTMLFGDDNEKYWLASRHASAIPYEASYGFRQVGGNLVGGSTLYSTTGGFYFNEAGVRAVVTLQSDIMLTGSSETGWSYTVN